MTMSSATRDGDSSSDDLRGDDPSEVVMCAGDDLNGMYSSKSTGSRNNDKIMKKWHIISRENLYTLLNKLNTQHTTANPLSHCVLKACMSFSTLWIKEQDKS